MPERDARWIHRLLPPGLLAACWVAVVCRILAGPTTHLYSVSTHMEEDLPLHVWQYWWVWRALSSGLWPLRSDLVTYPSDLDLTTLWGGHLDLVLGTPVAALFGPVAANNAVVAIMLATVGLGVYLLAREVSGDRLAAAMAGCLCMLSPPLLREAMAGRVEEMSFGVLAMGLAGWIRFLRRGLARDLALGTLAVLAAWFGYLGTAMASAFLLPSLGLGHVLAAWRERRSGVPGPPVPTRRVLAVAAVLAVLAAAVVAYGLSGLGFRWVLLPGQADAYREWICQSLTVYLPLWALFNPAPLGEPASLGPLLILVALLTLVPGRGRALPWWIASAVLLLLSLGPDLGEIPGLGTVPSPYRLLPFVLPFFLRFHWPYRFLLLAGPTLAVLAALGVVRLRDALGRVRLVGALPLAVVVLATLQAGRMIPLPVLEIPPLPETYRALSGAPGAVYELALPHRTVYNPFLAQTRHGRPLCCLDLPKVLRPDGLQVLRERSPFFAMAQRLAEKRLRSGETGAVDPWSLGDLGFSHVVVHRSCGRFFEHDAQGIRRPPTGGTPPPDDGCPRPGGAAPGMIDLDDCTSGEPAARLLEAWFGPPVREERLADGSLILYAVPGGSAGRFGRP